ncbi:hypothetical protein VNO80_05721 [Phaseolus coccineus]|uniref:Neprosin PEP catalytic domain-containing protein n=1 Tax=Phaseolus coccineus TaxID=3886 RepID=A0AAN9NKJ0_PHACN
MMNILFFILYLGISHISHNVDGIQDTFKKHLELETKSNLTHKSPVKTIHTKFGDIIDCIDIYKQPAFDHPLLKDHKLQKKPNFEIEKTSVNNSRIGTMFGFDKDICPPGTVPIQRTTNDFIEEKSLLNDHILLQDILGVHVAEVSLRKHFGPYYKVSGITSIYNPRIDRKSQISLSHVWVENGLFSANKISTGWHSDNFKRTGCYNVRCPGFVHTDRRNYLGGRFPHKSVYGGPTYEIQISITQDPVTKNWWIRLQDINIGYFPAALFSNLKSADIVGWGGRTRTSVGSPSPQMGSGYFPDGNSVHACYFRSALIQDASRKSYGPRFYQITSFTDKPKCFGVKSYGYQGGSIGNVLQFGGPGEFGEIVDCIDIYKQPAFDHPLLKDHKLQMKPNFQIETTTLNYSESEFIFGLGKDKCPVGTVPIQRTTKDDLMEENSNYHMFFSDYPGVHLAEISLRPNYGPYFQISGINSIYNPRIDTSKSQISMSHIWVQNGHFQSINKISAGWHVHPNLYGDTETHFYASWTRDNFKKTGCYNLRCSGFVHINRNTYLGGRFPNTSVYGGPTYVTDISITKDPVTKNWWLGLQKRNIGYFPAALFSNMSSANIVGWGGRTKTSVGTPSPQMGSGYFPDGNSVHACYFRSALIQDASRKSYAPKPYQVRAFTDRPTCFGVTSYGDQGGFMGYVMQFGGPGGNCGN